MEACVFVDGENFRHSIVNLFPHFHQEDYLPKLANWTEFFDWIVRNVTDNTYERIRTYWYVIKSVDFYPYSFQKRFNGWIAIQDGISSRHKAIEFRQAGYINFRLFDNSLGKEKAVDVKLATDLIVLKDIYDIAI